MFEHSASILQAAEQSGSVSHALPILRRLGLDDFGLFLLSLPDKRYPNLSRMLPRMTAEDVQRRWTGAAGQELLKLTVAFMRLLESVSIRHTGQSLFGKRVLDYGCGYGRVIRLLYYYTDPENIVGTDSWDLSLDHCRSDGLLGTLVKTDVIPAPNPCEPVDIAYAFSVFTHTSEEATGAILRAVRSVLPRGGLFVTSIRPIEFWERINKKIPVAVKDMEHAHRTRGYAFTPKKEMEHFGSTSMKPEYLAGPDWNVLGTERSLVDPVQLVVTLQAQ